MIAPLRETTLRRSASHIRKRRMRRARQLVASAFFDSAETPYRAVPGVSARMAWAIVFWMSVCGVTYFVHLVANGLPSGLLP